MNTVSLNALLERELSVRARCGYVALLLAALTMATLTGALWLTEPGLPQRTAIALAGMTLIGIGWAVYAAWVLSTRRVLLVTQRIVAARMAVSFCAAALAGAIALAVNDNNAAARASALVFALMLVMAAVMLGRARRRYRELMARKAELESMTHS
jgi:hypothetical protein